MNSPAQSDWQWNIDDVLTGTGGRLVQRGTRVATWVSTDSRAKLEGSIFVALKGDRFDGHEFASQAGEKASVVLVHRLTQEVWPKDVSVILVDDTLSALQRWSKWHRERWSGTLVGITGTNGKTTTKEFCRAILSQRFPTLATEGSLNNHWGVPLTLLRLRPEHRYAVIEMGMNHHGEIAMLVKLAQPNVVMVTNVGRGHMEFFSSVEDVGRAKAEIYENAPKNSLFIFNLDNSQTAKMREKFGAGRKTLSFSSHEKNADVMLKEKLFTLDYLEVQGSIAGEPGQARIPAFGRQQVSNAAAAACVSLACGLDVPTIWKGLALCRTNWGRGQLVTLENGARVLFDGYNANPESMTLALENFQRLACKGKKKMVLGEMLEQGDLAASAHEEMGQIAAQVGAESIIFVGPSGRFFEQGLKKSGYSNSVIISDSYEEKLALDFGSMLQTSDIVLIKGSRGLKLEKFLMQWRPRDFEEKH